jgi:hypothetical protein
MAHFAKLDSNNKVLSVHVVNNDILLDNGVESEQKGIDFLTELHGYSNWKQTSYNGSFRKNFAGIDFTYDAVRDAFIDVQPYDDWILDETICRWKAPVEMPNDGNYYIWDDINHQWLQAASLDEIKAYINQFNSISDINKAAQNR